MLESVSRERRESKLIYIIHMKDKNIIKLGRSNDSDVRMTDISVSRHHAYLKLFKGEFYFDDNFSKFGTLAQIHNNILVFPNLQLSLQSGKINMILSIKRTCLAWIRCYKNKELGNEGYNDYLRSKSPFQSNDEIENLQVINTNYTVSDVCSNDNNKDSMKKNLNDNDRKTFFYEPVQKNLGDLNCDLGDDEGYNMVKDQFKSNDIKSSLYKLTLTDCNIDKNSKVNHTEIVKGVNNLNGNIHIIPYVHIPNSSVSGTYQKDSLPLFPSDFKGVDHEERIKFENLNDYRSNKLIRNNILVQDEIVRLNTTEIYPKKDLPCSTKNKKIEYFKLATSNSNEEIEYNADNNESLLQISKLEEKDDLLSVREHQITQNHVLEKEKQPDFRLNKSDDELIKNYCNKINEITNDNKSAIMISNDTSSTPLKIENVMTIHHNNIDEISKEMVDSLFEVVLKKILKIESSQTNKNEFNYTNNFIQKKETLIFNKSFDKEKKKFQLDDIMYSKYHQNTCDNALSICETSLVRCHSDKDFPSSRTIRSVNEFMDNW